MHGGALHAGALGQPSISPGSSLMVPMPACLQVRRSRSQGTPQPGRAAPGCEEVMRAGVHAHGRGWAAAKQASTLAAAALGGHSMLRTVPRSPVTTEHQSVCGYCHTLTAHHINVEAAQAAVMRDQVPAHAATRPPAAVTRPCPRQLPGGGGGGRHAALGVPDASGAGRGCTRAPGRSGPR